MEYEVVAENSNSPLDNEFDDHEYFNPPRELLREQSVRPVSMSSLDFRKLSPFHRVVLTMDGTVTRLIEAYMLEHVEVRRVRQTRGLLVTNHGWLEAARGQAVVTRESLLMGAASETLYAYAASMILPFRLPAVIREGLEVDGGSLGRLLLAARTEQYREVLWWGEEKLVGLPGPVDYLDNTEFLGRTYRVIISGKPAMLISEWLPLSVPPGDSAPGSSMRQETVREVEDRGKQSV